MDVSKKFSPIFSSLFKTMRILFDKIASIADDENIVTIQYELVSSDKNEIICKLIKSYYSAVI